MLKRFFFTPVCLILLGVLLTACNVSIHAENVPTASPSANTTAVSDASPGADTTVVPNASPIVDASAVASDPQSDFPTLTVASGMRIIYKQSGQLRSSNGMRTVTGRFPVTPGFVIHVSCSGSGLISVEVSSGIFNELSCPQGDNTNAYYTSSPNQHYSIRITAKGAIAWRVVVEGVESQN